MNFESANCSSPWPIADYGEQGIFTAAQEKDLASRFALSTDLVSELSLYVGNTLDSESMVTLIRVSRHKAVKAAETALRRAIKHARKAARYRDGLVEVLLSCSTQFAASDADAALLRRAQALASDPESGLPDLLESAEAVLAYPGSAAILAPADKRELWDGRREHIVRSCCYVWLDAGRSLTYATNDGRRAGPLFEFIWAVMKIVLSDGQYPSDEAIRKDIDRFRDLVKRRPEILDGR